MPSFVEIGQPVPEKKIFEGFLPYMGMAGLWRPSWSCDLNYLYTHRFLLPIDASYKIWLWLAKQFQRRCLNIMVIYMFIIWQVMKYREICIKYNQYLKKLYFHM